MNLLNAFSITNAITAARQLTQPLKLNGAPRNLTIQANFNYGSGGTTVDAYVQTSLDGGVTWTDIAHFQFTTASARKSFNLSAQTPVTTPATLGDGVLIANTAQDGTLGPLYQVKLASTGTYAGGTTLSIDVQSIDINAFP